jgi:hypothetical protein
MMIVRRTDAQRILFDARLGAALHCARLGIVAAAGLCAVSACAGPFRGARFSEASLTPSDAAAVVHVYHIANYETVDYVNIMNTPYSDLTNHYLPWLTERLYVDGKNRGLLAYYGKIGFWGPIRYCEYVSVTLPPGNHEFGADYDPPFRVWSGLSRVPIAATATRMDLEAGQTYWVRIYTQKTPARTLLGSPKTGHTVEVVDRDTGLRDIAQCTLSHTP